MKYLLLCWCLLLLPVLGWADTPVTAAQADLNGDGTAESITLTVTKAHPSFTLRVGGQSVTQRIDVDAEEFACRGFLVVDIDAHDASKEILVETTDVARETQWLYWYDGKTIQRMGSYLFTLTFTGTGIVYHHWWKPFFEVTDKYVLDAKTHALSLVPQPFYYVGLEATILKSLPIYAAQSKKKVVANLLPKSKITILLNSGDWYLLKTSTGLTGWMEERTITPTHFDGIDWPD